MRASPAIHVALRSLFAFAVFGAAACGSDSTTSPYGVDTTTLVGVYTLNTVDGVALPAPAKDPTGTVLGKITAGSVTLTSAKTWTYSINYTLTDGTTGTSPQAGTYAVSGSTVTFTTSGGDKVTATFSGGNTLTVTLNTQLYVFKK